MARVTRQERARAVHLEAPQRLLPEARLEQHHIAPAVQTVPSVIDEYLAVGCGGNEARTLTEKKALLNRFAKRYRPIGPIADALRGHAPGAGSPGPFSPAADDRSPPQLRGAVDGRQVLRPQPRLVAVGPDLHDPERPRNKQIVKIPGKYELHRIADRRPEMYEPICRPHSKKT